MTGTFDDWAKSVKLDKEGGGFAKRVELPLNQNISYKVGILCVPLATIPLPMVVAIIPMPIPGFNMHVEIAGLKSARSMEL